MASSGFFKAVVDEDLEDGKLEIVGFVAINCKDFLRHSIVLTVPNGAVWPMELKMINGSVWLTKGWLEFANFYSLEQDCYIFLRVFIINDSCFRVHILNKIDHPFKSIQPEFSEEGYDAFSRAKRFKSDHPCLTVKIQPPYLIRDLRMNGHFVNQHICGVGDSRKVNLQIPNGKTWSAKCSVFLSSNKIHAKLYGGWTKFAAKNGLQVGDACVLELIKERPKMTFLGHIFFHK
ncbi:hypothetical protein M0R45_020655 [Rubus argutus]|uniref:TF-B3 domain-containing protein n=1 Tax=Rubus argutus TaxID=59490 RepID=A0AAW1XA62_RUBAR